MDLRFAVHSVSHLLSGGIRMSNDQISEHAKEAANKIARAIDNYTRSCGHVPLSQRHAAYIGIYEHGVSMAVDSATAGLQDKLTTAWQIIAKRDAATAELRELLRIGGTALSEATQKISELQRERDSVRSENKCVHQKNAALCNIITELRKTIAERDAEIFKLRSEIDDWEKSKESVEKSAQEQDARIAELENQLRDRCDEFNRISNEKGAGIARIAELEAQLAMFSAAVDEQIAIVHRLAKKRKE
jgi:chromosome segregation ATPase